MAAFDGAGYPACMRSRPQHATAAVVAEIAAIREEVRRAEGAGGQCGFVAEILADRYGWTAVAGMYLAPSLEPIGDHVWNVMADGTIVDATADQFCEGHDVRIVPPDDPAQSRYRSEWTADYNPGRADRYPELAGVAWSGEYDFDVSRRLRAVRGPGWWLGDASDLKEWDPHTGYGRPEGPATGP